MSNDLNKQYQGFLKTPDLFLPDYNGFKIFDSDNLNPNYNALLRVPNNIRFGQRMEYFMEAAFNSSARYKIIAKNLQIIHEKKTIGELDFLLRDEESQTYIHLEFVYKFYLFDPQYNENPLNCWIGSNRKDTLRAKIEKLKNHQLPILYRKETALYLQKLKIDSSEFEQQVCFKGQLFINYKESKFKEKYLNSSAILGTYINLQDFTNLPNQQSLYFLPQKTHWVLDPKDYSGPWHSYSEIKSELINTIEKKQSVFCWVKTESNEFRRFFVTWW